MTNPLLNPSHARRVVESRFRSQFVQSFDQVNNEPSDKFPILNCAKKKISSTIHATRTIHGGIRTRNPLMQFSHVRSEKL
jgi:hypothetical protein